MKAENLPDFPERSIDISLWRNDHGNAFGHRRALGIPVAAPTLVEEGLGKGIRMLRGSRVEDVFGQD